MKGIDDEGIVSNAVKEYNDQRELESMKLWLNLSRQNFKNQSCEFLKIIDCYINKLEDPLLTRLYESLINGNYDDLVKIIEQCYTFGFLDSYIKGLPYKVKWTKLNIINELIESRLRNIDYSIELAKKTKRKSFTDPIPIASVEFNDNAEDESLELDSISGLSSLEGMESPNFGNQSEMTSIERYPIRRGGHAMAIDEERMILYLFGGWSGSAEMNDLWSYDINCLKWKLLSSEDNNAPSPRSCTRMVYDGVNNRLLIYGKLGHSHEINYDRTLYEYNINTQEWNPINIFRQKLNGQIKSAPNYGPNQVYEHQMAFDAPSQSLYLFGGIKLPLSDNENGNIK